ncbi:MAG TPA: DUF4190 domain-containing protein [Polyangia bacterium]|jgi:hypothetical protein
MAGQFIVTRNGRESFCTEEELRKQAERGLLAAGDLVYHPVLGRWLYGREVEEVRAQMEGAAMLGRVEPDGPPLEANGDAVAGFVLGVLGHLPLVGLICCLFGIYFSGRGIGRAAELENRGHGLAVAGMVLSIIFLVPATVTTAVFLSSFLN